MYVLVNGHTLWRNSPNLICNVTRENMSQSEFRFAVTCIWYAMFRKTNGRMEVLHYPVNKQTHHRRSLAMTVTSTSIAEKCFDIWGILKMASVKSVESGNNCFSVNHTIRFRSKFLPLGFSKFVLVLIL